MALATALQYTESNLIGQLHTSIDDSQDNLQIVWRDSISGEYRVPDATTRLVVIDKGSANFPSTNYEIVYLPASSTTTNNITTYASGVVRGLSFNGFSLATGGLGTAHIANAEVGPVDVHYFINCIVATLKGAGDMPQMLVYTTESARNTDNASPANGAYCVVTATKSFFVRINGVWTPVGGAVYQNAAARDAAIASPVVGMSVYLIDEGYFSDYSGSGWSTGRGTTSVNNATASTTGVVKLSTAPVSAGNPIAVGDNDSRVMSTITVTDLTDGGDTTLHYHASDRSRANHTGTQDMSTLINTGTAGETLSVGELVALDTDNLLYKATNTSASRSKVIGVMTSSGTVGQTVAYGPTVMGRVFVTTGLTVGTYYLGTGGAITATPPVLNSSSIYPVIVGYAPSTTVLVWGVRRLQRRTMGIGNIVAGTTTTSTLTVGYPIERVMVNFSMKGGGSYSTAFTCGEGHYDVLAGTQEQQGSQGSSSNFIYVLDMTDGAGTKTGTASINGSNNVEIAWVESSFSAGNNALFYRWTAFERL